MSSVLIFRSAALFSFTCLLFVLNPVLAQTPDISTEHVIIDLSVINNPEPKTSLPYYKNSQKLRPKLDLLLPGFSAPISMLHISVPKTSNHIKLKKLSKKSIKSSKKKSSKTKKNTYKKLVEITRPVIPEVQATKPPVPLIAKSLPVKIITPLTLKEKISKKVLKKPEAQDLVQKLPKPPEISAPPVKKSIVAKSKSESKKESVNREKASLTNADKKFKTNKSIRVKFNANASKFPIKAKKSLRGLVKKIKGNDKFRLQLMAYAGGKSISASKARRLSLSRALSVRSFLIESGIKSTRIDVRALGSKTSENPLNRVDVNIIER